MKKLISLVAVLAVVTLVSSSVFAAPLATKTAYATFSSVALTFNVKIYEWNSGKDYATGYTGSEASSIAFDVSGYDYTTPDTLQWAKGTVFAKISSNLTSQQPGTKIYMYTDNTTTGEYKANAPRIEEDEQQKYNGLVRKGNTTTYQNGDYAPVMIMCKKVSDANKDYKSALPTDFSALGTYKGVRYLVDKSDSDFGTLGDDAKVIATSGVNGGVWTGYGENQTTKVMENWYSGNEDVIIFFGARFSNVMGGSQYGTTTIKFAQTIE